MTTNYSAHVMEKAGATVPMLLRAGQGRDAQASIEWAKAIGESIKFELPPMGQYITRTKLLPVGTMPQRMPYASVSLEVPFSDSGDVTKRAEGLLVSTRRHILAREAHPKGGGMPASSGYVFGREGATGVHLQVFAWMDEQREWYPMPYGAFMPYDARCVEQDQDDPDGRLYAFATVPGVLPDWHERMAVRDGAAAMTRNNVTDVTDEVKILVEFLQVLACRNVRERSIEPDEKLNRQRIRRGRTPFDVVRVLAVGDVQIGVPGDAYRTEDGFKVREHMRSGHIRRLPDHQIWVNDCIVAAGSPLGRVKKTYSVA